jgi:autotransporter-associated beta strand protein
VTTLNGGILNLGSAEFAGYFGPLGDSPASNPGSIVFNGGTLQYSVNNQNDYSGRFSTAANQNIVIDTNGQTVTFATALTSSNGALTLNDSYLASPGALILTAASTYTGPTTVLRGTLVVSGSLNGTSSTTVTNATLAGTGYIANSVSIGNELNPTGSA